MKLGITGLYWSDDTRLKSYYIKVWLCTDTWVGQKAYLLDGELVAVSYQPARKASESFSFVRGKLEVLRTYLQSLVVCEPPQVDILEDSMLDDVMPNGFSVEYNTQILHSKAVYMGEDVTIVRKNFEKEGASPNYFHSVEVKRADGSTEIVDCSELLLSYNSID